MTSQRKCLKCNDLFNSSGPGNRICPDCAKRNKNYRRMTVHPDLRTTAYRPDPPPDLPVILEVYGQKEEKATPKSSS